VYENCGFENFCKTVFVSNQTVILKCKLIVSESQKVQLRANMHELITKNVNTEKN